MTNDIIKKLQEILSGSKWTQEQLAHSLGVTFSTLNGWINGKATPRTKAIKVIDDVYLNIVGRVEVDQVLLSKVKQEALSNKITVKEIIENEPLLEKITLLLTYHTNTIEGSTMTLSDVKEVLEDDNKVLANKTAKEQTEARNHRTALFYLLDELSAGGENFKWTKEIICSTHLRLMNTLISDAGRYRSHGVRIQGSHVVLINHVKVPESMDELIADLNKPTNDIIASIAQLHARFEQIHPFSDGNGRTGRLVMFIQALQHSLAPPIILKERKHAYYRYLETAQADGKFDLLVLFVAESILAASGDIVR